MKLTILTDNNSMSCTMQPEHGLSIWLETDRWNCLLDCGPSPRFAGHAAQMGIDLKKADYLFLSHGHNDHCGGLLSFLKLNDTAPVLVAEEAMQQAFYSTRETLHDLTNRDDFATYNHRFAHSFTALEALNIFVYPTHSAPFDQPKANAHLKTGKKEQLQPDTFDHERIFATVQNERLLVFTGCSHRGILNILQTTQQRFGRNPDCVVGGFHFPDGDYETEEELRAVGKHLKTCYPNTLFYTGHCTGEKAFGLLQQEAGAQIRQFYTGLTIRC